MLLGYTKPCMLFHLAYCHDTYATAVPALLVVCSGYGVALL